MKSAQLAEDVLAALEAYRAATTGVLDSADREDFSRLVAITENVVAAMRAGDASRIKLGLLGFSRHVSDAFAVQPVEFKALSQAIGEARRFVDAGS